MMIRMLPSIILSSLLLSLAAAISGDHQPIKPSFSVRASVQVPHAVPIQNHPAVPVQVPHALPVKNPPSTPIQNTHAVQVPGPVPVKGSGPVVPVKGSGPVVPGKGPGPGPVPVKGPGSVPVKGPIPPAAKKRKAEQHKAKIVRVQQFLETHNNARVRLGLKPLIWDAKLQQYSKKWAVSRAKDCKLIHSHGPYGENMFWSQWSHWTPDKAVGAWLDENKYYNAKSNSCASGKTCGHYTQIMWRSTARIGCTRIKCDKNAGFITVCSYDPPGNYEGEGPLDLNQIVD